MGTLQDALIKSGKVTPKMIKEREEKDKALRDKIKKEEMKRISDTFKEST